MKVIQSALFTTILCLLDGVSPFVLSNRNKYSQHLNIIKKENFPCSHPQRRAVSAKELVQYKDDDFLNYMIYPEETILYRCESSGCCKGNKTCKAHEDDEVPLTFLVVSGKDFKHIEIVATNHTSCSCQTFQKEDIK